MIRSATWKHVASGPYSFNAAMGLTPRRFSRCPPHPLPWMQPPGTGARAVRANASKREKGPSRQRAVKPGKGLLGLLWILRAKSVGRIVWDNCPKWGSRVFTLPSTRADRQPHFGQGKPVSRWAWRQRCDSSVPVLRWGPGRTKSGRGEGVGVSQPPRSEKEKVLEGIAQAAKTQSENGTPRQKPAPILPHAALRACLHEADGPT